MSSEVDRLPRSLLLSSSPIRDTIVPGESYPSTSANRLGSHLRLESRGSPQYVPLPTQDPSQAESSFTDGSDVLFSLYNEKAAEYDQKLAENWREDAQGIMLLVRSAVIHLSPVNTHPPPLEWSLISHSGNVPFTRIPGLSDEFPRRLGVLSQSDLPTTGQFQSKYVQSPTTTRASKASIRTQGGIPAVVSESGVKSRHCRIRHPATRMGAQILAPLSTSVQPIQACTYSSLHGARGLTSSTSAHDQCLAHVLASLRLFLLHGTHRDDRQRRNLNRCGR